MNKYFKDRLNELHAITWPTKKQATHAMVTVLTVMLITGFLLTALDAFFNKIVLNLL
ncbi:preprotein translocase subunit SecE [Candidatus Gracilibacteria bacterium]|nr:preprotein translocase subunit SecE [Candidatus Gracilibacteria bacterium]